jgi:STAS domain
VSEHVSQEEDKMLTIIRRPTSGGVVVAIEGPFDVADVDQLHILASTLDADGPVSLDFHKVRSASDTAIARLAGGLRDVPRPVWMVGLSEHQRRLLKYIGLATGACVAADRFWRTNSAKDEAVGRSSE